MQVYTCICYTEQFEKVKNELPMESSVLNNEVDGLNNDFRNLKQVAIAKLMANTSHFFAFVVYAATQCWKIMLAKNAFFPRSTGSQCLS